MDVVRTGIIGLGQRGKGLLNTVLVCERAKVVALCDAYEDRVEEAAETVREKKGFEPKKYADYKELLADENVDAVIIASSWDEHIRMAIESMKAGKITAMEVGGAYDVEECWELVRTYEKTKTPFMMLENCCFNKFELLVTSLARAGKLGEVVHCHGAYRHDLRKEVLGGNVNRHYRLDNYEKRCAENYPTHELGPIAKLLDINRGNRMMTLTSVASKAAGLEEFAKTDGNPDKTLIGKKFKQGDIVSTIITCANGETVTLTLNTTLPVYYSREFEAYGTKGLCRQEENLVAIESDCDMEEFWDTDKFVLKHINNAENYSKYLPDYWRNITQEEIDLGHGGMDLYTLTTFFNAAINGEEMPVDVYDAASWACITALSEQSIATGGSVQPIPDFTCGKWLKRKRKDVVEFPKVD